jgi:hypothetical protein
MSGIYFRPAGIWTTKLKPVLKKHDQKIWLGAESGDSPQMETLKVPLNPSTDDNSECFEFQPELVGLQHQELGKEGEHEDDEEMPQRFYEHEEDDGSSED